MDEARILVADDEQIERETLGEMLRREGYEVEEASNGLEALEKIEGSRFHVVVADIKMPKLDGMSLLKEIIRRRLDTKVILITGYADLQDAVEAMDIGAFYYLEKPVQDEQLKHLIRRALEHIELTRENILLRQRLATRDRFYKLVGRNEKMQEIYKLIEAVAPSNATVLILGESGTGKELVAHAIHESSPRSGGPFVKVNCGALPENLLESELFGHVKGAFTTALRDRIGKFEYADGGTIFLDEIDALPPHLQVKLLRVIQDQEFERVGDNRTISVDVRIIAASNRDLEEAVEEGSFRADLFYRLNVIQIKLPPLRERKDDIPLLVDHFLRKYRELNNKEIKGITEEAMRMLEGYDWPGNVRELENVIERAVVLETGEYITSDSLRLPSDKGTEPLSVVAASKGVMKLKEAVEMAEKEAILKALQAANWRRMKAAELLGINRITLYNKMRQYGITEEKR